MSYSDWELDFLHLLQGLHNPVLNKIMVFITELGNKNFIWLLGALIMILTKKYRKCGCAILISLLFSIVSCNLILKNFIARERPSFLFSNYEKLINAPLSYAFPSGHTQNAFSAAFSIFFMHQKEGIAAIIIAAAIAFSRMYLFVHWPTDILSGIVFSLFCALFACMTVNILFKKKSD